MQCESTRISAFLEYFFTPKDVEGLLQFSKRSIVSVKIRIFLQKDIHPLLHDSQEDH